MNQPLLIFIALFCFITMAFSLRELSQLKHDIKYGHVVVRGEHFKTTAWKFTKERK